MFQTGQSPGHSCQSYWASRKGMALLTDWYELTMMGGYHEHGIGRQRACFEYFFRELPPHNGFAVLVGIEALLSYLQNLKFEEEDITYLRSIGTFSESFLDSLREFKFTCDVWAAPEGTVIFPYEPVVSVTGPLMQAQLIETFLLNALNYPTLVATKAARICQVANGDPVIEFGLRRAQGPDGGLVGSRAAYIGGCAGTSNVLAGKHFGIPVMGTMAHSWIMSFPTEMEAFRAYAQTYPDNPILLIDTYDTLESGVNNAITLFRELVEQGTPQRLAIRLDSGDLAKLSKAAHSMITRAGFAEPMIVASNELDEELIADLKRQKAKINAWGVGTNLITCKGAPALTGVYKLVAIEEKGQWQPRLKRSSNPDKTTDPGIKQVVRTFNQEGIPVGDVVILETEKVRETSEVEGTNRQMFHQRQTLSGISRREWLTRSCIEQGKRIVEPESLDFIRARARKQIGLLPEEMKRLRNPQIYPVLLSVELAALKERMIS